jgi:archaellin
VGIGTLVVFIALVLVAAVAAGVLISTAGVLQASGEATGQQSLSQVTNNLQVQSVIGYVQTKDFNQDIIVAERPPDDTDGSDVSRTGKRTTLDVSNSGVDGSTDCTYDFTFDDGGGTEALRFEEGSTSGLVVERIETGSGYGLQFSGGKTNSVVGPLTPPINIDVSTSGGSCNGIEVKIAGGAFTLGDAGGSVTPDHETPATVRFQSIPATDVVDRVVVTVSTAPGAESIDVSETTISYVGSDTISQLVYDESSADSNTFTAQAVSGDGIELREPSDRVQLTLDVTDISKSGLGLTGSESIALQFTTEAGATRSVRVTVPPNLYNKDAVPLN